MKRNYYNHIKGNVPRLNKFDWSYSDTFSASIGYLYPVQCDLVYPGTVLKMNNFIHAEVMPLVAPLMCDLQVFVHSFFVPLRLLYGFDSEDGKNIWEKYISGGEDGTYNTPLPSWSPSATSVDFSSKLIWDYIGLPMAKDDSGITPLQPFPEWSAVVPAGIQVMDFPKRAYNLIYNEYYRDEFHIQELDISTNEYLQRVSFRKDYFTSAVDNPVLGPVSALPLNLSGIIPVMWSNSAGTAEQFQSGYMYGKLLPQKDHLDTLTLSASSNGTVGASTVNDSAGVAGVKGSIDASGITSTTFDVNELRFSFAVQRLLELSAISGVRYTEFLNAHFGVSPSDARLDRPEYIGGCVNAISVSPSVQHSETTSDSVQGKKVGVASLDSINKIGTYRCLEHGVVMTLLSVRPKPIYKTGVNRQFLNKDGRFSFYSPEFAFLGQQPIYNCEVYTDPTAVDSSGDKLDSQIFGYQDAWNFLRSKDNMVSGAVREQFKYWTMAREFASHPALNQDFLEVVDSDFNQIFAVQNEDEFIFNYANLIQAYLPLPAYSNPGLIDHVYGQ